MSKATPVFKIAAVSAEPVGTEIEAGGSSDFDLEMDKTS